MLKILINLGNKQQNIGLRHPIVEADGKHAFVLAEVVIKHNKRVAQKVGLHKPKTESPVASGDESPSLS